MTPVRMLTFGSSTRIGTRSWVVGGHFVSIPGVHASFFRTRGRAEWPLAEVSGLPSRATHSLAREDPAGYRELSSDRNKFNCLVDDATES